VLRLKNILTFGVDGSVYIADYTLKNKQICKTCTVDEFLRELVEYSEEDMAHIMKVAKFRRFSS
jgi:hypothetical protein